MTFPATVLPIRVDVLISGVWTNITSYAMRRESGGVTIERGRADEATEVGPSSLALQVNNRDLRFTPRNPTGPYYGLIGRNTPIRVAITSTSFLAVDVQTGTTATTAYVSTPDTAALDITGDVDLRFDGDLNSWREPTELVSKWTETGNQRSYLLRVDGNGYLWFHRSTDGTAAGAGNAQSTVPVPVTTGRLAVRGVLDVNNGAGGRTTYFYTAPTSAGPWTQLGLGLTGTPAITVFAGTSPAYVLDNPGSTQSSSSVRGKVYSAQIYSGIAGSLVANPDFTVQTDAATSFVDSTGKTWTLSGDVDLTTRDPRFHGEVTRWPQHADTTGTDVWVDLEAKGVLRRLGQGQAPLDSTLKQGIQNLAGVLAYWPLEDDSQASRGASGIADGYPMQVLTGTPDWGAYDGFKASKPILQPAGAKLSGTVGVSAMTGTIQCQFIIHVPTSGTVNNAVILRILASGTIRRWDLRYTTGGSLTLSPYDRDDALVAGGLGPVGYNIDGVLCRLSVEIVTSGANIALAVTKLDAIPGATASTASSTVIGQTVGVPTKVLINPSGTMDDVGIGHVEVNDRFVNIYNLRNQLTAYQGETAGRRIERLCAAQGVMFSGYGDLDDTARMGYQFPDTFLTLIQDAAAADLGILSEERDALALGYRPASSLYGQTAAATLDYVAYQLAGLDPVEDDQLLRNDVTVSRPGGSEARATIDTGPLSTADPTAGGAGTYDTTVDINVESDDDLPDQASWRAHIGTIDQARYPAIVVNLAHSSFTSNPAMTAAVSDLDVGSRLVVTNPPGWIAPGDVSQVVQGYTEFLANYERQITFTGSPSWPYDTAGFWGANDAHVSRYSSDGSTLNGAHNSTTTSLSIATPTGPRWITTALMPGDFPFDIIIAGERITVTAASGTTSPQTFSPVVRSVNGVVKALPAGSEVALFSPAYYVL